MYCQQRKLSVLVENNVKKKKTNILSFSIISLGLWSTLSDTHVHLIFRDSNVKLVFHQIDTKLSVFNIHNILNFKKKNQKYLKFNSQGTKIVDHSPQIFGKKVKKLVFLLCCQHKRFPKLIAWFQIQYSL